MVWDEGCKISDSLKLTYDQPEELRPIFESFGNDLSKRNGLKPGQQQRMPLSGTIVVGTNGKIASTVVRGDWTIRQEATEVVSIVKALK